MLSVARAGRGQPFRSVISDQMEAKHGRGGEFALALRSGNIGDRSEASDQGTRAWRCKVQGARCKMRNRIPSEFWKIDR